MKARRFAEEKIERFADKLKADEVVVCLSDDWNSFRKDRVDPTYKLNRNEVERPVHLYDIKDYLAETYDTVRWTSLEADDVMGIMQTDPSRKDETIIVSSDKDMMTVPGKLYRPPIWLQGQLIRKGMLHNITPLQGILFHFWQTIVGDSTDGYIGARGVGPKSEYAQDVLKAESEEEGWDIVLDAYASKGLTETEALKQARMARILQYPDWDGKSPILWLPPYVEPEWAD